LHFICILPVTVCECHIAIKGYFLTYLLIGNRYLTCISTTWRAGTAVAERAAGSRRRRDEEQDATPTSYQQQRVAVSAAQQ